MPASTHRCPALGCTRRVSSKMLTCQPHWFMIPGPFRRAIHAAWAGGAGAGSPGHAQAITAAVDALNKRIEAMRP